jgi:hypothetical protein
MSRLDLLGMTSAELLRQLAGSGHSVNNPDRDTIKVVLQTREAEAQDRHAKALVRATWALVVATGALIVATIAPLFRACS